MTGQKLLFFSSAALILGLTVIVATLWVHETTGNQAHTLAMQQALQNVVPSREIEFNLTDHQGAKVSEGSYRGQFTLVYFGYTSCVDICPHDLAAVAAALDILGNHETDIQPLFITIDPKVDLRVDIQPLFITIDPKVDTQAVLSQYVPLFHPKLIGLTGSLAQVTAAAKSYGASFEKEQIPRFTGHGHSSNLYLIGPDGAFLRAFRTPTTGEVIASIIKLYQ